ncbi:MAG: polysaccharide deacetylase family protein [Chloroflexi bacterium]|nr:polysaccharide deacetylase family protein [Chloroflexota bacterium]
MKWLLWVCWLLLLTAGASASGTAAEPTPAPPPPADVLVPLAAAEPLASDPADTETAMPTAEPTPGLIPSPTPMPVTLQLSPLPLAPKEVPTHRPTAHPRETQHVPVLMYHHIAIPPENADAIRLDLSVPPASFEEQMAYFAAQGYHAVKPADVYDAVVGGKPLPSNPIVFTFDDGYDDNYLNALPILKKFNFTGTFYIPTGLLARPGYMTWEQIALLEKSGMDIESHSVTHPSLKGKTADFIRREAGQSKRALEAALGAPVQFFCYPAGAYDKTTIQVLQELGYLSATTTQAGAWQKPDEPYQWPRVRIHGKDRVSDVAQRVRTLAGAAK